MKANDKTFLQPFNLDSRQASTLVATRLRPISSPGSCWLFVSGMVKRDFFVAWLLSKQDARSVGFCHCSRQEPSLSFPAAYFQSFFKVKCILVVWQRRNLTKGIRFIISDLYRQEEQESEIPMKILFSVVVELLLGTRALTDYQHMEYFII